MKDYPLCNDSKFWWWLVTKILSSFVSVSVWGFLVVFFMASFLNHAGTINSTTWGLVISVGFFTFLSYRKKNKGKKE